MATHGNVVVTEEGGGTIYLYQHWDAYNLPGVVARALDRDRRRWDDGQYLTRILFSQMLKETDMLDETTGFGLSTTMGDGGVEVYVDLEAQTVKFDDEVSSFEEFVNKNQEG